MLKDLDKYLFIKVILIAEEIYTKIVFCLAPSKE